VRGPHSKDAQPVREAVLTYPQARSADVGEVTRGAAPGRRGINVVDLFGPETRVKVPLRRFAPAPPGGEHLAPPYPKIRASILDRRTLSTSSTSSRYRSIPPWLSEIAARPWSR
jgi:hypothetical protein